MLHVNVSSLPRLKRLERSEPNPHVYTEGQISQQLGILHRGPMFRLGYIMALIREPAWKFPEPLPRYIAKRDTFVDGAASVSPLSQWRRDAVDTWFERFIPPGVQAAAALEQDRDGAALDANADALADRLQGRNRA